MGKWNFATCQHYISWYINPVRENLTTRSNCGTNQGLKKNTLGWCRGVICNLHKITENRYPTSAPLPPPRKQVYPLNPLLVKKNVLDPRMKTSGKRRILTWFCITAAMLLHNHQKKTLTHAFMDALGTTCHDHFKKEVRYVLLLKTVTPIEIGSTYRELYITCTCICCKYNMIDTTSIFLIMLRGKTIWNRLIFCLSHSFYWCKQLTSLCFVYILVSYRYN